MILITGGLGYLGGRIAQSLLQSGENVRVGTSRKNAIIPMELSGCDIAHYDLLDIDSLYDACDGITTIVHLAAMNAKACANEPEKALLINGQGTLNLLKAASSKKVKKFLFFSTAHVYGSPLQGYINEDTLPKPIHPYSITHRLAEDYVIEADENEKIHGTIFRLSNAVGAPISGTTNCWSLVVNDVCRQIITNKSFELYSRVNAQRDYVPISEICNAVYSYQKSKNNRFYRSVFNLSCGVTMTLQQLSELIVIRTNEILGYKPKVIFQNDFCEHNNESFVISNEKIKNVGVVLKSDLSSEIDNLLLNCKKWYNVLH